MRFPRTAFLTLGLVALVGCQDDPTNPSQPPLGGVRFINALADTTPVDIKFVDQVEWTPMMTNNINFRAGTAHEPTEAKQRRVKVFAYLGSNPTIDNVSKLLLETTIDVPANQKTTFLLTGSARAGDVRLVAITDDPPALAAGQIAVRSVNASTGAVDVYYVASTTTAISGAPTVDNLGALGTSGYVTRATGAVAARVTAPDDAATINASQAGPTAPTGPAGATPAAGVDSQGSAFSVYYFPRGVAGSPQNAVAAPTVVWFIDAQPLPASN
jgi:hypothetical protein